MSLAPLVYSLSHMHLHSHFSWTLDEGDLLAGVPLCCPSHALVDLQSLSSVWVSIAGIGIRVVGVGWIGFSSI